MNGSAVSAPDLAPSVPWTDAAGGSGVPGSNEIVPETSWDPTSDNPELRDTFAPNAAAPAAGTVTNHDPYGTGPWSAAPVSPPVGYGSGYGHAPSSPPVPAWGHGGGGGAYPAFGGGGGGGTASASGEVLMNVPTDNVVHEVGRFALGRVLGVISGILPASAGWRGTLHRRTATTVADYRGAARAATRAYLSAGFGVSASTGGGGGAAPITNPIRWLWQGPILNFLGGGNTRQEHQLPRAIVTGIGRGALLIGGVAFAVVNSPVAIPAWLLWTAGSVAVASLAAAGVRGGIDAANRDVVRYVRER